MLSTFSITEFALSGVVWAVLDPDHIDEEAATDSAASAILGVL
jgi:hypothetical protein